MVEFTMLHTTKVDQCRLNAQLKSERKRQAVFDAIADLKKQGRPITRAAIARLADVSRPFLSKHADLLQAIDEAEHVSRENRLTMPPSSRGRDVAIAALQRQVEKLKQQVREKDTEIRRKQRDIDQLYGKLANRSEKTTDAELRLKLAEMAQRLQAYEAKEE